MASPHPSTRWCAPTSCRTKGCWRWSGSGVDGGQAVGQRFALVEDEAFALPMRAIGLFEVLQNAALELVDMIDAGFLHEQRRLFAADPARAKAHHRLAAQVILVLQELLGKLAEFADAPIDGTVERAVIHFERVAGVQRHDG